MANENEPKIGPQWTQKLDFKGLVQILENYKSSIEVIKQYYINESKRLDDGLKARKASEERIKDNK